MDTLSCAHVGCNCLVSSPGDFCGNLCRDQAMVERNKDSEGDLACGCGHAGCYRQADSSIGTVIEEELES